MKKTYWWRMVSLLIGVALIGWGYISMGDYFNNIFLFRYNSYVDSIMFLSLSIIAVSLVLFFINDNVFMKWFKFALGWILVSLFFISITPEYGGGFLDPDREQVSIWMSSLFLIISLILIIVWSIKEKKSLNKK